MASALSITSAVPDPALLDLPWNLPLELWPDETIATLPKGISRHLVRFVHLGGYVVAIKETSAELAKREYDLLRMLQRLDIPCVEPVAVITDRVTDDGQDLAPALVTRHLRFSLPYRALYSQALRPDTATRLVDALAVLLARLHVVGFFWGDVSLSNTLFRRDAGSFAAYLVDAETGEIRDNLSASMREYDVSVGCENVFAELLDLQASESLDHEVQAHEIVQMLEERYRALWDELTAAEEFSADEMWRLEQRVERLNDLGFDVDELDIVTDWDGEKIRIQPKVVELGHHRRELQALTGLNVEDAQARRILNDIASFTAHFDLGREDRTLVANRWLTQIYEPIIKMVPPEARGKLEPAEVFHEVLQHRWYLSERAGQEVDLFDAARDYMENVLTLKPDEAVTADED